MSSRGRFALLLAFPPPFSPRFFGSLEMTIARSSSEWSATSVPDDDEEEDEEEEEDGE